MPLVETHRAGDSHLALNKDSFYTETVNGVALLDWVSALIASEAVVDVHCTDCTGG